MSIKLQLLPEIERLEETPIENDGQVIGWHVNVVSKNNYIGSGIGLDLDVARRIAIAEAIERWSWSKWIDEGYIIPELNDFKLIEFTPLTKYLYKQFDSFKLYQVELNCSDLNLQDFPEKIKLCIFIGLKNGGVFPGSRVCALDEDGWSHAVVESWRHLVIFKSNSNLKNIFPCKRINYFGTNAEEAINKIIGADKIIWPKMKLLLHENIVTKIPNTYVFRTLLSDYIGWDKGDEKRFVY